MAYVQLRGGSTPLERLNPSGSNGSWYFNGLLFLRQNAPLGRLAIAQRRIVQWARIGLECAGGVFVPVHEKLHVDVPERHRSLLVQIAPVGTVPDELGQPLEIGDVVEDLGLNGMLRRVGRVGLDAANVGQFLRKKIKILEKSLR